MSFSTVFGLRVALFVAIGLLVSSCGAPLSSGPRSDAALAIVAVATAPDVSSELSDAAISSLMRDALVAEDGRRVEPLSDTKVALGGKRHRALVKEFAATGRVANEVLQQLMATPLKARRGLLVRIEHNETDQLDPSEQAFRSASGQVSADRTTVVLSSRRQVRVSATILDLTTGSVRWQRAWAAAPVAQTEYVRYTGNSFSGSVTATIANSVVNGLRGPAAPSAPDLDIALKSIFEEMAKSAPNR